MKSSLQWVSNLKTKEEKESFKAHLSGNKRIFDRMEQLLEKEIEISIKNTQSAESFSKPNWSQYQAYELGKQSSLNSILALLPNYKDE